MIMNGWRWQKTIQGDGLEELPRSLAASKSSQIQRRDEQQQWRYRCAFKCEKSGDSNQNLKPKEGVLRIATQFLSFQTDIHQFRRT